MTLTWRLNLLNWNSIERDNQVVIISWHLTNCLQILLLFLYSNRFTECRYKLASAVVHLGNAYSGHFLTYRRAPSTMSDQLCENWMCVSDENVYTAVLPEVLSQKSYMLYYQRAWFRTNEYFNIHVATHDLTFGRLAVCWSRLKSVLNVIWKMF